MRLGPQASAPLAPLLARHARGHAGVDAGRLRPGRPSHRRRTVLIVLHNRPSGEPSPSVDDVAITRRLQPSAVILGPRPARPPHCGGKMGSTPSAKRDCWGSDLKEIVGACGAHPPRHVHQDAPERPPRRGRAITHRAWGLPRPRQGATASPPRRRGATALTSAEDSPEHLRLRDARPFIDLGYQASIRMCGSAGRCSQLSKTGG